MKVAIIYNKDFSNVINTFGIQNKEKYNPKTVKLVSDALEHGGHNVSVIDGDMHVIESLQDFMPKVMEGEKMGMVFNMAYGIQGESRYTHLPSMLEMLGIPYVGSTPAGHAVALDKVITKIIMQKHGIPTPDFWVFNSADEDMSSVEYPVIVKPKMEAVSFGLKVVYNVTDLRDAVDYIIKEFEQQALVEQFIRGREFAIGLLGNNPVEAFPALEIDLEGDPNGIQTVDDKKHQPRNKICPAAIPETLAKEMKELSIKAFKALGLRDFSRVDIRLDENNNIYLLEINSMASLGVTGSYIHAAKVAGLDYKSLVNKILDVASFRYFTEEIISQQLSSKNIPYHIKIRSFLRGRQTVLEGLLQKCVNLNTYVRNVEGVNNLGNIIKKELKILKFSEKTHPKVEIGNILYFTNTESKIDILLIGNLDNNIRPNRQEYFSNKGQKLFGSGIWEHKGGLVTLIGALQALRFIRQLNKIKIGILLTSDDSLQGKISKDLIKTLSPDTKAVIGLHGAFLNGGVVTSRSGSASYKISLTLKDKQDSENIVNATKSFNKIVNDISALSKPERGVIISPSKILYESNITEPFAHGEAEISVRYQSESDFNMIDNEIRKTISNRKYKKLIDCHIEGGAKRPPMEKTNEVVEVYSMLKNIANKIDVRLLEEHRWSSANISFSENAFRIDGLGPLGTKPQNGGEHILQHSLIERMALLALMLIEFRQKSRS